MNQNIHSYDATCTKSYTNRRESNYYTVISNSSTFLKKEQPTLTHNSYKNTNRSTKSQPIPTHLFQNLHKNILNTRKKMCKIWIKETCKKWIKNRSDTKHGKKYPGTVPTRFLSKIKRVYFCKIQFVFARESNYCNCINTN